MRDEYALVAASFRAFQTRRVAQRQCQVKIPRFRGSGHPVLLTTKSAGQQVANELQATIPHENHTRRIAAGKAGRSAELRVPVCVVKDGNRFMLVAYSPHTIPVICFPAPRGYSAGRDGGRIMRTGVEFTVSAEQRRQLEAITEDGNTKQKHAARARIILLSDDGLGTMAIAAGSGTTKPTVWRWQERFMEEGVEGLLRDKTRPPGKPPVPEATVGKLVATALSDPPAGETHWTLRALAAVVGLAVSTVHGILSRHKIAPHRWRHFKVSTDPDFEEKVHDVVGLYVKPPKDAVVLSIDEKTQIQALGRPQKGLPMKPGRPATMTHDYKRHGTTTLFAALNILDGTVIGRHSQRHRHQEFLEFLEQIEASVPAGMDVHIILDNYAAHKHGAVMEWIAEREGWELHFTPTSCSWLNAVEGFFGKLARRRLRRGVHDSIEQLEKAILDFIDLHNGKEAKPFNWTASPERIIAARQRGNQVLRTIH